jgi:hypothetical protein
MYENPCTTIITIESAWAELARTYWGRRPATGRSQKIADDENPFHLRSSSLSSAGPICVSISEPVEDRMTCNSRACATSLTEDGASRPHEGLSRIPRKIM